MPGICVAEQHKGIHLWVGGWLVQASLAAFCGVAWGAHACGAVCHAGAEYGQGWYN